MILLCLMYNGPRQWSSVAAYIKKKKRDNWTICASWLKSTPRSMKQFLGPTDLLGYKSPINRFGHCLGALCNLTVVIGLWQNEVGEGSERSLCCLPRLKFLHHLQDGGGTKCQQGNWITSPSREGSGKFGGSRSSNASIQMSPSHISGSPSFPIRALTLPWQYCLDWVNNHLWSSAFPVVMS